MTASREVAHGSERRLKIPPRWQPVKATIAAANDVEAHRAQTVDRRHTHLQGSTQTLISIEL